MVAYHYRWLLLEKCSCYMIDYFETNSIEMNVLKYFQNFIVYSHKNRILTTKTIW